jgi:hypothetical protein
VELLHALMVMVMVGQIQTMICQMTQLNGLTPMVTDMVTIKMETLQTIARLSQELQF